jgi:glycosyltransferase involved in cell wall biosynthesis
VTARRLIGFAGGATDELTLSLIAAVQAAAEDSGYRTRGVEAGDGDERVDVLLAVGLPQYYEAVLKGRKPGTRAIAWFGEPLPASASPAGSVPPAARKLIGRGLRLVHRPLRRLRAVPLPMPLAAARAAAYVERERQANLEAAGRSSVLVDLVVTTSHQGKIALDRHGVDARVVPFGYQERFAGSLVPSTVAREIDVVSIGSGLDWASRRAWGTEATLDALGPRLKVAKPDRAWGDERHALLSTARVMLDVHRIPGNFVGLRLLLALAAGVALVTEPLDDPRPFVPGVHYVEAPLAELPDAIRALLADEPARRRIVDAGQTFISTDLTMERSLAAVLA